MPAEEHRVNASKQRLLRQESGSEETARGRGRKGKNIENVPRENERLKGDMPKKEEEMQEYSF